MDRNEALVFAVAFICATIMILGGMALSVYDKKYEIMQMQLEQAE